MPTTTVTRRTVTTSRSGVSSTTAIPLWAIKLVAAILSIVILILVFLQHPSVWSSFSRTFIFIVLTCGFILGWSIQSVLWRFLQMHRVDAVLHSVIVALALISTVLCIVFLIDQNRYSRSDAYSYMVGTTICMGIITLITFFLIGCLCRGNYTFVDTH